MDIQYLITFQTILETGSFSKAAEQLGYTQSAVTFQIQQLEQELSTKLFEKFGKNMHLTENGQQVLPLAKIITDTFLEIKEVGCIREEELTGKLTIAISESLMVYNIQEIIQQFKEMAPKVKLSLLSKPCSETVEALKSGKCDIGILYHTNESDSSLFVKPIINVPMVLVSATGQDLSSFEFISPNQVIHTNFFINEPQCVFRKVFNRYLTEHNITLNNTIELGSIEAIRRGVASGLGISYLPRFIVSDELDNGIFQELPMEDTGENIYVGYALHRNKWKGRIMDLCIKITENNIK